MTGIYHTAESNPSEEARNYVVGYGDLLQLPPVEEQLYITEQGTELRLTKLRCGCFEVVTMEPMEGGADE